MTRDEWKKIVAAKELFGLDDRATLTEIKQAYRGFCKQHHPDLAQGKGSDAGQPAMHEITAAYRALLGHCEKYRFPLVLEEADQPLEGEEWWMDRFGRDPLWGKG